MVRVREGKGRVPLSRDWFLIMYTRLPTRTHTRLVSSTCGSEGAGGGHAPDIISVCGEANVIPSSTNPTKPYTVNTVRGPGPASVLRAVYACGGCMIETD